MPDNGQEALQSMSGSGQEALQAWIAQLHDFLTKLPTQIDHLSLIAAVVLIPLGVISLLYGFRIFKGIVVAYSAAAGAGAGWWIAVSACGRPDLWWVGLLAGGVLLAVLAWPLINFFVGFWGAVAGGLVGLAVGKALVLSPGVSVLAVVAGVVVGAILAVLVFRFMIAVTTSVLGSALAVVGLTALLYHVPQIRQALQPQIEHTHFLLPLIVAGPALVGVIYQMYNSEGRQSKDDKKTEDQ